MHSSNHQDHPLIPRFNMPPGNMQQATDAPTSGANNGDLGGAAVKPSAQGRPIDLVELSQDYRPHKPDRDLMRYTLFPHGPQFPTVDEALAVVTPVLADLKKGYNDWGMHNAGQTLQRVFNEMGLSQSDKTNEEWMQMYLDGHLDRYFHQIRVQRPSQGYFVCGLGYDRVRGVVEWVHKKLTGQDCRPAKGAEKKRKRKRDQSHDDVSDAPSNSDDDGDDDDGGEYNGGHRTQRHAANAQPQRTTPRRLATSRHHHPPTDAAASLMDRADSRQGGRGMKRSRVESLSARHKNGGGGSGGHYNGRGLKRQQRKRDEECDSIGTDVQDSEDHDSQPDSDWKDGDDSDDESEAGSEIHSGGGDSKRFVDGMIKKLDAKIRGLTKEVRKLKAIKNSLAVHC
eukprot:Opistho-2@38730